MILCSYSQISLAEAAPAFINDQGFRYTKYRSPTPESTDYGTTVDTAALQILINEKQPVLIDVQAVTVRPELADFEMDWLPSSPRYSLPGAIWLPNVGYAELDDKMETYLRHNLKKATGGDKEKPLVIYCVVDCWLSWNAMKRIASYGYKNLYWYSGGTDDWGASDLELIEVHPEPL